MVLHRRERQSLSLQIRERLAILYEDGDAIPGALKGRGLSNLKWRFRRRDRSADAPDIGR